MEADSWKASEEHMVAPSQMNQVLGNVGHRQEMDGPGDRSK